MKIYFAFDSPIMVQHYDQLGIKEISTYFEYSILDFSCWMNPGDERTSIMVPNIIRITNNLDLEKYFNSEDHRIKLLFSRMVTRNFAVIYKTIKKCGIYSVCIDKESFGVWLRHKAFFDYRGNYDIKDRIRAIIQHYSITRKLAYWIRFRGLKYDYKLSCCNYFPEECKHFIRIHHPNYDETICLNEKLDFSNRPEYALFIDTALSTHPAYNKMGINIDSNLYSKLIREYFDRFEKETGIPIIISGYPKVTYEDYFFGNREIIYNHTPELIKNCKVVLAHTSSSVIDAIIFRKPITFLIYDEMRPNPLKSFWCCTQELASLIGQKVDDLRNSCNHNWSIDETKYAEFENVHIKNRSKEKYSNIQLIVDFLETFENNG